MSLLSLVLNFGLRRMEVNTPCDWVYSSPYQPSSSGEWKKIDTYKLIQNVPTFAVSETTITINIFSNEDRVLGPCEKALIGTGVAIESYYPVTHSVSFEGLKNNLELQSSSKYIQCYGSELEIKVTNFSAHRQRVIKGMPLGILKLSPN